MSRLPGTGSVDIGDTGISGLVVSGIATLYCRSSLFIGIYKSSVITIDIRKHVFETSIVLGYDR